MSAVKLCKRGHLRTPDNVDTHRHCRECALEYYRERSRKRREDPEYRTRERKRKQNAEYLERQREYKRELRRDPEYRERELVRERERASERYATDVEFAIRVDAANRRYRLAKREAQPPHPPLDQLVTQELERRGLAWPTTP